MALLHSISQGNFVETPLQHHLAPPRSAVSILGAFRRILSIFVTLSLLNRRAVGRGGYCSAGRSA